MTKKYTSLVSFSKEKFEENNQQQRLSKEKILEKFLAEFVLHKNSVQEVFKYLHWFCRTKKIVFPKVQRIAKNAGCSRMTVHRALNTLEEEGYLIRVKKFWRPNVYIIPDFLLKIDLKNKDLFNRNSVSYDNVTLTEKHIPKSKKKEKNVRDCGNVHNYPVQFEEEKKEERISFTLNSIQMPREDKIFLSKYSERVLGLALEDLRSYQICFVVRNTAKFLVSRCKEHSRVLLKKYRLYGGLI